jgi:hypothetical protein
MPFKVAHLLQEGNALLYRTEGEPDRVIANLPKGTVLTIAEQNALEALYIRDRRWFEALGPVTVARELRRQRALRPVSYPLQADA